MEQSRITSGELPRPTIVCLCGSTKFYQDFQKANYEETLAGKIVLSVGFFMHSPGQAHGGTVGINERQKYELDELHLRKIDLADEVLIINSGDYIGASTRREAWYAAHKGKRIRLREQPSRFSLQDIKDWFMGWDDWLRAAHSAAKDHLNVSAR